MREIQRKSKRMWERMNVCHVCRAECVLCEHLPHKWILLFNNQKEVSRVAQTVKHPI